MLRALGIYLFFFVIVALLGLTGMSDILANMDTYLILGVVFLILVAFAIRQTMYVKKMRTYMENSAEAVSQKIKKDERND